MCIYQLLAKMDKDKLHRTLMTNGLTNAVLKNQNLDESDGQSLAVALPCTQITQLDLSFNDIRCSGLKYISFILKHTKITDLNLASNNIRDEGVKYLAEMLGATKISKLDLTENHIGTDAALYLIDILSITKITHLTLDVHCSEDSRPINCSYARVVPNCNKSKLSIYLPSNNIGPNGAQYLNKISQHIGFDSVKLKEENLNADHAKYLAQAFKNAKIFQLQMCLNHMAQPEDVEYLVRAFKESKITELVLMDLIHSRTYAKYVAEFLKHIKVVSLRWWSSSLKDEDMKLLAPAIRNNDIMHLDLSYGVLEDEGIKCLADILKYSKIIYLVLPNNSITTDGAKYLAQSLPFSQVRGIHLSDNKIGNEGLQHLIDVLDQTNIDWIDTKHNEIKFGLRLQIKLGLHKMSRKTISVASKLRETFKELISFNPASNEFEFILSKPMTNLAVDIDKYIFLFKTLKENPNSKVHIFDMICAKHIPYLMADYDLSLMNKINEFLAAMPKKFNIFFGRKLPELFGKFQCPDFVNLVKNFEDMQLDDFVKELLFYRLLYYEDENQTIICPYIYRLLKKYKLPIY